MVAYLVISARKMLIGIGLLSVASVALVPALAGPPGSVAAPSPAETSPVQTAAKVDRLLAEEVFSPAMEVASRVDDEMFLRRAWLDVVGDLPSPEQITAFALDPDPGKRTGAVERLLADPQFGQNWARYWRDVILYRRLEDRALIVANSLVVDLTSALNQDAAWDKLARRFITAVGDVREEGCTAIVVAQNGRTEEITAEMSRIFLGVQIQCAQCHDHPYDEWTREQFHELAAFFPRVAMRRLRSTTRRSFVVVADDNARPGPRKNNNGRRGAAEHFMPDLANPREPGTLMKPTFFLTGQSLELGTQDTTRRETLADWMIASPWFSKALVNRIWAEMVGEGFYEPVDDIGPERTCTAPRTLEYLAEQFVKSGYDIKWLFRTIAATEVYQRESRSRGQAGNGSFAASRSQRLRSDVLYNTLTSTLEVDPAQRNRRARGNRPPGANRGPRGRFQQTFGYDPSTPRDEITGSIPQALAMMNGREVQREINGRNARTMLGRLLRAEEDNERVTVDLYLRTLAREPSKAELKTCLLHVRRVGDRGEGFEDVLWALLNLAEFLHRR